ncbi:ABC transporter ATP-binding protein [Actinokineospora globicatena]|uniref:ABC transporter ATP-binding protein n=1 Tax=Actinokineospora globicatena TaxID=103729 RepID=UPI0020A259DC|nr:ABC transporter ATP-binding protein [Actinokineospora globicatena]MCP2305807.1 ABC-type multidrug transport system, ATPase and permease component [Actinokineospora globicatena]GLW80337.1 multidrug ABC transporter permease [Actinokineospora globicatena]GLW87165.1 multidrug ABC transporter permease [Actinokineospora globicatena]
MAEIRTLDEAPPTKGVLRRFWPHLRPHRWRIGAALLTTAAATAAVVGIAPVIGSGVDAVLGKDSDGLWTAVFVLIGLTLARLVLLAMAELQLTSVGERVVRHLRELVVDRLAGAPLRFIEAHRTGDLLRRSTGEVAELAQFVRASLPDLLGAVISLSMTIIVLLAYSWLLTVILLAVFLPAAVLVLRWFERDADDAFGDQAAAEATMAAQFTEFVAAGETLRLGGGVRARLRRFGKSNDEALRAANRSVAVQNRLETMSLLEGLSTAVLLLLGVWFVTSGQISVGTVVVFVLATKNLFEGVLNLSELLAEMQLARVGLARLLDLLGATERPSRQSAAIAPPPRAELSTSDLGYAYIGGSEVLHDVSVSFAEGDRAGLVGQTGSGKTTLAKLLSGLYTPDRGQVTYGGVDLADLDEADLRGKLVLVPQQVHLVDGTIADNLALAPTAPTRADMVAAVHSLGLDDWVASLPDGLDTVVGRRGDRLSAGERQILGLVRASLVDPAVLILDEATADIDPETSARLERAVDRLHTGRTLIVIAHREATIERLPRVVTLAGGRVVQEERAG